MRVEVRITTIAIKLEGKWVLDTYCRIGNLNDKKFVENFMNEYAGNGIDEVKILETEVQEFYNDTIHEATNMYNALEDLMNDRDGNHTILNY
jgi:hypothetical protein